MICFVPSDRLITCWIIWGLPSICWIICRPSICWTMWMGVAVTLLTGTCVGPPCPGGACNVIWISFGPPALAAARTWGGGSWVWVTAWAVCWLAGAWFLCFFLWCIKLLESANLESQDVHAYGLSPVWTRLLWTTNLSDLKQDEEVFVRKPI